MEAAGLLAGLCGEAPNPTNSELSLSFLSANMST